MHSYNPAASDMASAREQIRILEEEVSTNLPPECGDFLSLPTKRKEQLIEILAPEKLSRWRALRITEEEMRKYSM